MKVDIEAAVAVFVLVTMFVCGYIAASGSGSIPSNWSFAQMSAIGSALGGIGAAVAAILALISMRRSERAGDKAQEAQDNANKVATKAAEALVASSEHQLKMLELHLVDYYACLSGVTAGVAYDPSGQTIGVLLNLWNRGGKDAIIRNAWIDFSKSVQDETRESGYELRHASSVTAGDQEFQSYFVDGLSQTPTQSVDPHNFGNIVVLCGTLPDGEIKVSLPSKNGPAVETTLHMKNGQCEGMSGPSRVMNPGQAIRQWLENPHATFESLAR